jgi:membrane-bound lytic murein transglycosylase F
MVAVIAGALALAWVGEVRPPSQLDRIKSEGVLRVGTRLGPSSYYQTHEGPTGLEYELAKKFAASLGVKLELQVAPGIDELAEMLDAQDVDVVCAGLTPTADKLKRFSFSKPYMEVRPQLVYRAGSRRPDGLDDLQGGHLEVIAGSSHQALLKSRADELKDVDWEAVPDLTSEDLLYRVWSGRSDFAITDSNKLLLNQHFYPELRAAADVGKANGLAWMLRTEDTSLRDSANAFIEKIHNNGSLATLIERYYGHLDRFDYVGTRVYMRHVTERLPRFRKLFEEAAKANGLDWRLLAAIGYQESHWNPKAVSPTGVRGVMMLTRITAEHVGIDNRLDPAQSIRGGAKYFASIRNRIPKRIPEPIRSWFALAAYNVGFGHLEDARVITEMQGADPDSWSAVKQRLPLLSQKKWYSKVDHGYARGAEPVQYVENIRKYYQLLMRVTEPSQMTTADEPDATNESAREADGLRLLKVPDGVLSAF